MKVELDATDRFILRRLQADARVPFLELARELKVAGGTIHARVNRLKELGIITGTATRIARRALGYTMTAFVGITVDRASEYAAVAQALEGIKEILEIHYTTGDYALYCKICIKDSLHLHKILATDIQVIPHITSTHTIVILDTILDRELVL